MIVNTADEGGGAERMSIAVLNGMLARGIDAWLLVGDQKTNHPRVVPFYLSPFFDYGNYFGIRMRALGLKRHAERWLGIEDFNFPHTHWILGLTGSAPDLVLCHNLHGGYFDLRALSALSRRVPVVMRLFDSWTFTGHCAYSFECQRWQTGCGRCPDLNTPPSVRRDATRFNWRRKSRIYSDARIYASAETQWMIDRAKKSLLAPAVAGWKMIRGGVDLTTFHPGPQAAARLARGVDPDAHIVLYVANQGDANAYKDFATVRAALETLPDIKSGRRVECIVVGATGPDERIAPQVMLRRAGYIRSREHLADLYRAADVYAHSAVDETYGLSVAEALACGAPVAMASSGGVLELVEQGRTALTVPPRDAAQLGQAIARMLDDPPLRAAMGDAAAASARAYLDERMTIGALLDWCVEVRADWRAHDQSGATG